MTIMITAMSKTLCCRHYQLASCPSGSKWPHRAFPKVAARIETWVWGDVVEDDVDGDYFDSVLSCLCKKYDQDQDLNHLLHLVFQEY